MTPEQRRQAEDLHRALQEPGADRDALLDGAGPEVRSHVERLLAQAAGGGIPDSPVADLMEAPTCTAIAVGARLGPYQIESQIGAGGMGTVYRALDTRLGRIVAIKVVTTRYNERFQQEARAISALNHPNICTLYDIGPDYLVMELMDGETLKQRIARGRLSVEDVLRWGREIAAALTDAHAHGIIHRDLKPANIMLTRTGLKVLDFGLAKVTTSSGEPLTQSHVVMGTPAYMAPEQVRGEAATPQVDLFALGLTLYEMAAGQLPFPGASLGSMLVSGPVSIPPVSRINPKVPHGFDALVSKLLEGRPEARTPSAAQVFGELGKLSQHPGPRGIRWPALAAGIVLVMLAAAGGLLWSRLVHAPSLGTVTSATPVTTLPGNEFDPAFSPDGRQIAFIWTGEKGDNYDIYTMEIGSQTPRRLTDNPADEEWPVWSPDGSQIAFLRRSLAPGWDVILIPAQGGLERKLGAVYLPPTQSGAYYRALAWTPDSKALVVVNRDSGSARTALFLLSLVDGTMQRLPIASNGRINGVNGSAGLSSPAISADGRWLAFVDAGKPTVQRLTSGYQPGGPPLPFPLDVVDQTQPEWVGDRLVVSWNQNATVSKILLWDLKNPVQTVWAGRSLRRGFSINTHGQRVRMITSQSENGNAIWALPLDPSSHSAIGPPVTRLVSSAFDCCPVFSFDGSRLAWTSSRAGGINGWLAAADGTHSHALSTTVDGRVVAWFRDGKRLIFFKFGDRGANLIANADSGIMNPLPPAAAGLGATGVSGDDLYLYGTMGGVIHRVRMADGKTETVCPGFSPRETRDGKRILYTRRDGVYARSLAGDVTRNPELLLAKDLVSPVGGMSLSDTGAYYLAEAPDGRLRAFRYLDFATGRVKDVVAPPPLDSGVYIYGQVAVAPNQREILFSAPAGSTDLTMLEFSGGVK